MDDYIFLDKLEMKKQIYIQQIVHTNAKNELMTTYQKNELMRTYQRCTKLEYNWNVWIMFLNI